MLDHHEQGVDEQATCSASTTIRTGDARSRPARPPRTYSNAVSTNPEPGPSPFQLPRTRVVSYFHRRPTPTDKLSSGKRVRCFALYAGNLNSGVSSDTIVHHCERKSVPVIKCSVSETKYFGLSFAHVVVPEKHRTTILREDFWPSEVRVRELRFKSDRIANEPSPTLANG